MERTALITGIAGQDGSYLAELLLEHGYRVIGTVPRGGARSLANLAAVLQRVTLVEIELTDQAELLACLSLHRPDELYNLAAMSFSPDCWNAPYRSGEILGLTVVKLMDCIRQVCPQCRFFQAGSSEMFGMSAAAPQNEATPIRPASPYGAAKAYAHHMVQIYRDRFGLFAVNGILYPHESPRRDRRFLTRKVTQGIAAIVRKQSDHLKLGSLDGKRDWSFAGDFVRAMWLSLRAQTPEDYVFSSGQLHSVAEFCETAFAHAGLDFRTHIQLDPQFVRSESGVVLGDSSKAHATLGWTGQVGFRDLVSMMVDAELASPPPR